jgi:hypothetical protein
VEWIPAFAGMTAACYFPVLQMTPVLAAACWTGSLERGFGEAYIVAQPEIEMGTSYDEQMASRRLRVFFILWQTWRMQE